MTLILVVLAVGQAIRTEKLCRQIPDLLFQVVGCGFDGAPHCVAPKSLEKNHRSAMAEPPTILFHQNMQHVDSKARNDDDVYGLYTVLFLVR